MFLERPPLNTNADAVLRCVAQRNRDSLMIRQDLLLHAAQLAGAACGRSLVGPQVGCGPGWPGGERITRERDPRSNGIDLTLEVTPDRKDAELMHDACSLRKSALHRLTDRSLPSQVRPL